MDRKSIANHTLEICKKGFYTLPNRDIVFIETALATSVANTELYLPDTPFPPVTARNKTAYSTTAESTLQAIYRLGTKPDSPLACLNFASARNPGGGFLNGSQAQEESLARSSGLYPALLKCPRYYEENRACPTSLYLDYAIWSPGVPFFKKDSGEFVERTVLVSVITSPAPNAGAIRRQESARIPEIGPTLLRRATQVLHIAAQKKVDRLILGAWGCGVFQNNPEEVAAVFYRILKEGPFQDIFSEVVFAIYDKSKDQGVLKSFKNFFQ